MTEQGEVIFARYADVALAQAHLERLTSAVLLADPGPVTSASPAALRFAEVAAQVERASRQAYLDLVRTPGFADVVAAGAP